MRRADRKVEARKALARLWADPWRPWKWRAVAAALGVEPRVVSQWNAGALAPDGRQMDTLIEMGQSAAVRKLMERLAAEPTYADVEEYVEVVMAGEPLSARQVARVERALDRTMPRMPARGWG